MKRFFACTILSMLVFAPLARAASPLDVVINEVAWMGTSIATDEWIELYNTTDQPVDLNGWRIIDDAGAQTYNILTASCSSASCVVAAHGFFLIEKREQATDAPANLIVGTLSFANAGDSLELQDNSSTPARIDFLDTAEATGGWYAGSNSSRATMERRSSAIAGDIKADWGSNNGVVRNGADVNGRPVIGTPGQPNSLQGNYPPGPEISHIHCLDATAIDVWFTTAPTSASAVLPDNYGLTSGAGEIHPTVASVDSNSSSLVHLTGISGLNVRDLVTLSTSGVVDENGLGGSSAGSFYAGTVEISFARTDADKDYVPDISEDHPTVFVTVRGVVTSTDDFSLGESFLQDATAAISIFDPATTSLFIVGDEIRISGTIEPYNGRDELVSTRSTVLTHDNPVVPTILTAAELLANPEGLENMLVKLVVVTKTAGTWPTVGNNSTLNFSDAITAFDVYIDKDTNLSGPNEPTYPIDLTGIVNQRDTTDPRDGNYQLLPRALDDITQSCYSGTSGTQANPPCHEGIQSWTGSAWGPCLGEVVPAATDDTCDLIDNNCDGTVDEGANIQTDPLNCGSCGGVCDLPNVDQHSCANAVCGVAACDLGFGDCSAGSGCETEINTDPLHCGACVDAACNLPNTNEHGCAAGICTVVSCNAGFGDCSDGSGCETDINADPLHCGACVDAACNLPNTKEHSCVEGECGVVSCKTGFEDCTNAPGCETTLGSNDHCGACGDSCARPNAQTSCKEFKCEIDKCEDTWGDCDGDMANGCETVVLSAQNCGACDFACENNETCVAGKCSDACQDLDGDSFAAGSCGGADCDDSNPQVYPGAVDDCGDNVDQDCDGTDAPCTCPDSDHDGFRDQACSKDGDCNDRDPAIHPNAQDVCDQIDNNCNGEIDEGAACDKGSTGCGCSAAGDAALSPTLLAFLCLGLGWIRRRK